MAQTRRGFLKLAGAATALAAAHPREAGAAQTPASPRKNGNGTLPKGLTLCTLRSGDRFTLGVRTKKGVLDVEKAAKDGGV